MNQQNSTEPVAGNTDQTPMNEWRYATFLERLAALVLDYIFSLPAIFLISVVVYNIHFLTRYRLIHLVVFATYNILSLYFYGTTLGKHVMKLKVISDDNGPLTLGHILLRETVGKILSLILIGIGYTAMIVHPRKQTWHDRMAHTLVVKYPKQSIKKAILLYVCLFPVVLIFSFFIALAFINPVKDIPFEIPENTPSQTIPNSLQQPNTKVSIEGIVTIYDATPKEIDGAPLLKVQIPNGIIYNILLPAGESSCPVIPERNTILTALKGGDTVEVSGRAAANLGIIVCNPDEYIKISNSDSNSSSKLLK